jgi:predicted peptidase
MERKIYSFENKRIEKFNYLLHIPKDASGEGLPLIVALHGAGERGDDFSKIPVHGLAKYIEAGLDIPAVVIAPQCPENFIWNLLTFELKELIDFIISEYGIDRDRVSITGLSMGGYGTWEMGMSYPGFFAALAPICGGGVSWRVGLIGKTPVWAFHGDCDTVVPPVNSIEMCERLKASGGDVKLTLFHGVDHNSWEPAYEETKVIEFLLSAKRG